GRLEEAADRVARDAQCDDARGRIDSVDRVGRDQAALAREATAADGKGVRDVRVRAVHRALDRADPSARGVGYGKAGRLGEVVCYGDGHVSTLFPVSEENPAREVRIS